MPPIVFATRLESVTQCASALDLVPERIFNWNNEFKNRCEKNGDKEGQLSHKKELEKYKEKKDTKKVLLTKKKSSD